MISTPSSRIVPIAVWSPRRRPRPVTESHPDPALARASSVPSSIGSASSQALSIQLESARSQIANAQAETKTAVEADLQKLGLRKSRTPHRGINARIVVNNHQSPYPHDWLPQTSKAHVH